MANQTIEINNKRQSSSTLSVLRDCLLHSLGWRGELECSKIDKNNGNYKENIIAMCRNIKTLFNFDPPATEDEIQAASLQFVRKLSGFNDPSKANEAAFNLAIEEVAEVARNLLDSLVTNAGPRNREVEIERARFRAAKRFGTRDV